MKTKIGRLFDEKIASVKPLHRQPFGDALEIALASLAEEFGAVGRVNFRVFPIGNALNNYIDVVWRTSGQVSHLFEIDSSVRTRSIKKLASQSANVRKIWIYYGSNLDGAKKAIEEHGSGAKIELIDFVEPQWVGRGDPSFTHSDEWERWKDQNA
jgi:hypothetical protein